MEALSFTLLALIAPLFDDIVPVEMDASAVEYKCVDGTGGTVGVCGANSAALLPCGAAWATACSNAGGTAVSCSGSACDLEDVDCQDNSALLHGCDEAFITACESETGLDGDFDCTGSTCCPENCLVGTCETN